MDLIECVPNVSEARHGVIGGMAAELGAISGLALLDYSSDVSHNRSVFTLAGDVRALETAVMTLAARVIDAVDLRTQRGAHPRIGALDVVPFIPLRATTMSTCVDLAQTVGRALAERFSLPIYLYEEASAHPARRRLEDIRRGGFEGLALKMTKPEWAPDFGPAFPHPTAGATVVGARPFLIAFNVNLATDRLDVARHIAATIRERHGGLPCVKALGLALPERQIVQVSMNLTDFTRTPVHVAFDAVRAQAAAMGVDVRESELIGLMPRAALSDTTPEHLRLRHFSPNQILEERLARFGL